MDELKGEKILLVGEEALLWKPVTMALKDAKADVCFSGLRMPVDPVHLADFLSLAASERPSIIVYMEGHQTADGPEFMRQTLVAGMNALHTAAIFKARLVLVEYDGAVFQDPIQDAARQALLVLARAYRKERSLVFSQVLPCPCYGPGDILNALLPRLVPALLSQIRTGKDNKAKNITFFGSAGDKMPLLHVEDAARAVVAACALPGCDLPLRLMPNTVPTLGEVVRILVKEAEFQGDVEWDQRDLFPAAGKLEDDGIAREVLGWEPKVGLEEGLAGTVKAQFGEAAAMDAARA